MKIIYIAYDETVSNDDIQQVFAQAVDDGYAFITARNLQSVSEPASNHLASLLVRAEEIWTVGQKENMQTEIVLNKNNWLMGPRPMRHFNSEGLED